MADPDRRIQAVEVRLNDIRERLPVQLSLFDEKKPIKQLHDILPEWAQRHRAAAFYRLQLTHDVLPEHAAEKQRVSVG